ncbi:putative RecQ-like ATP-dependent DNA helicase [Chlorella virus XW01]|nr:putative RecQ-like ATP-dependent DNA helicase [Chlorella virus XW01]
MKPKYLKRLNKYLSKYWKIDNLKDKQLEIIDALIDKKDVVGLLPTGYGKSLTYLIPPLIKKKTMIIISPLISLMEDQKEKLDIMNIPVSTLHSNNPNKTSEIHEIIDGNIKIVYMSPEYLITGDGLALAETLNDEKMLGFLAIDEAHCISKWGHDFRPNYQYIHKFRTKFPKIPILAVTATATETVVNEIIDVLTLNEPLIVKANFDRPNLYIKCVDVKYDYLIPLTKIYCLDGRKHIIEKSLTNKKCKLCKINPDNYNYKTDELKILFKGLSKKEKEQIEKVEDLEYLKPYLEKYKDEKVIIYCNSRKETLEISDLINKYIGDKSINYHAGMTNKNRDKLQHQFNSGEKNIIVTTIAFGMGIDQTVRCVMIIGSSSSIEEYYQQIGRAGRDGNKSDVLLFFKMQNLVLQLQMNNKYSYVNKNIIKNKRENIFKLKEYLENQGCRRKFILNYFGQRPKFFTCNNCDNCCERNLIDYTDKIYNIYINNIDSDLILSDDDKTELISKNILILRGTKLIPSSEIEFWLKMVSVNKLSLDKIPDKLKIKI